MASFWELCSSLSASHMHYLQHLEKDAPCMTTTPLHTLPFTLLGMPFLPSWYCSPYIIWRKQPHRHIAFSASCSSGGPATSSVHALKLTSVTVLAVTEISLSLPPHYTPLTGQYHTPLISGLVESGDNGATVYI